MPQNWKTYKLSDALEIKYGKDHKKVEDGDIPIYGTGGVMRYGNQFLYDQESILIPRKGSLNNIYYINEPFWTVDTLFWSKINTEIVFPKYLFYNLKLLDFANMDVGSAIPSLTTSLLNKIDIVLPPLPEQTAIASILSALDDKIELNLQQNKTLEEMAMALYKNWFVDFGPFQEGEFVESELGMIPKGWEVKRLEEIADVVDSLHKTPEYSDVGYPMVRVTDIKGGFLNLNNTFKVSYEVYEEFSKKYKPKYGDVVMSRVGTYGISAFVASNEKLCLGQNTVVIVPIKIDSSYLYTALSSPFLRNQIEEQVTGSTQKTISLKSIRNLTVALPIDVGGIDLMNYYGQVKDWLTIGSELTLENQILTNLRDTLLPKLISGEVRVKDVEHLITEAL